VTGGEEKKAQKVEVKIKEENWMRGLPFEAIAQLTVNTSNFRARSRRRELY